MKMNPFLRCCRGIRHWPTSILCILVMILQDASINYYLVTYKEPYWLAWIGADACVIIVFIVAFIFSYRHLKQQKLWKKDGTIVDTGHLPMSFIAWLSYTIILCIKVAIIFKQFAFLLDEDDFFGPNTLKTSIALAGIVFLLLLSTQHDAPPGTEQRRYIEELTGTVIFDILDGVDMLDILFDRESRDLFPPGMDDALIAFGCINLLLPTIPLITLSRTHFGMKKLSEKFVLFHKMLLAFLVNLPLLITRMIIWHGLSRGISIFSLKNIIVIGMISYDLYEHNFAEKEKEERKGGPEDGVDGTSSRHSSRASGMDVPSYALEDRFNYMS